MRTVFFYRPLLNVGTFRYKSFLKILAFVLSVVRIAFTRSIGMLWTQNLISKDFYPIIVQDNCWRGPDGQSIFLAVIVVFTYQEHISHC